MHHQTIHGVGPNHADQARVNVYFRVTASHLVSWCVLFGAICLFDRILSYTKGHGRKIVDAVPRGKEA